MKILFNTDRNINGDENFRESLINMIDESLSRFENYVTRIEVHLSDENSTKSGPNDKRCLLEARMESHQPIAVTAEAENYFEAVANASDKMKAALDSVIGKMKNR